MAWCPLHVHTHYSLLRSAAKPKGLAKLAANYGYPAMAMTDTGNLGCAIDFATAMKAEGIKPIFGCEFSLCNGDPTLKTKENGKPYSNCVVLAKNLAGWRQLLRAVSKSASKDYAHYGPRLSLEALGDFTQSGDLIAISGYMGSDLANSMFGRPKMAYAERSYDRCKEHVKGVGPEKTGEWRDNITRIAEQYISVFGRDNFFLAHDMVRSDEIPATKIINLAIGQLSRRLKIPTVALPNVHYLRDSAQDANDQRVLLCTQMKTSILKVNERGRAVHEPDNLVDTFFGRGSPYYLPAPEDLERGVDEHALRFAGEIADLCESYDITSTPRIPHFECPDGMTDVAYLRELCERGWRTKVEGQDLPYPIQTYRDRLEMELGVVTEAGLSSYFLIVQDFLAFGRKQGWLLGPRGSGAGCIISWLIDISDIDPVRYGLIFERFYNAGRNAPGRVSLPDIDVDIPKEHVDEVFYYMQGKFGVDYVSRIATFNSMQGRSALTAVMGAHNYPFDTIKRITKFLPDKARISEELEEMRQRGEEPSIIGYALDFLGDALTEWVQLDEATQRCTGVYAREFEQAMRLEGTKTHIGMHAAGVAVGAEPLAGLCPMKWDDKHKCNIAGLEWTALEAMGVPKFDVLALAALDKMQGVRSLVRTGRVFN